jgi:alkanesulfonate monooxygenase SsuD/methylene tetrahydromethanopterin reductase-like flavin-dependent oxidoreductase (luciferase family)
MFRTYYFSEMPYPHAPEFEFADVTRVTMPNKWLNPDTTNQVYNKYFDLVRAADDLGLDVMFNEHHQTLSNLNAGMPLSLAIAARETKNCRLLALGNPVANRPDPVRVAMEMAMIDVISHGRLECGFIRGIFYELSATNARPTDMLDRMFEAADLIVKAWTMHEGAFNWEGEFFHHREVSIVPRPYQQPHPPVWGTTTSVVSAVPIAERGWNLATIFIGKDACAKVFATYRDKYAARFGVQPHPEKLAYSAFMFVGDTDEEALREAPKIQDFLRQSFRVPKGTTDVPGYYDVSTRAAILRKEHEQPGTVYNFDASGRAAPQDLVRSGVGFYGNPDSVFEQMKDLFYKVGGFGNFIGMCQGSDMSYALTTKSMKLFAEHVLPRFRQEVYEPWLKENGLKRLLLSSDGDGALPASEFRATGDDKEVIGGSHLAELRDGR